ncbi:MAG: DUF929 family protein [Candidatus Micrarchaeia archaeon]
MKKIYEIIIVIVAILFVSLVLWYNATSSVQNTTNTSQSASLVSYDNVKVNSSVMSMLSSIALNNTLANKIANGAVGAFPQTITSSNSLTQNNKSEVLYIGADYCPYCAAVRWGLIVALLRFGNFTNLSYMTSSATDIYPSTPTFTFYNSSYQSNYIAFVPVEVATNTGAPLEKLTNIENVTFQTYGYQGSIPFIDFGNQSVLNGATFSPQDLDGKSWINIISELKNSNSTIAQDIIGSANIFTAQICKIDGGKPSSVCTQKYVEIASKA